jgi:hypothetical protein
VNAAQKGSYHSHVLPLFFALTLMGNTQSGYTLTRTAATLDSFISELGPEIVYEKRYVLVGRHRNRRDDVIRSLGSSRFLKTVRCRHRNGPVVVKIYIKPDLGLSLGRYQRNLRGMCHDCTPLPVLNEPPGQRNERRCLTSPTSTAIRLL